MKRLLAAIVAGMFALSTVPAVLAAKHEMKKDEKAKAAAMKKDDKAKTAAKKKDDKAKTAAKKKDEMKK